MSLVPYLPTVACAKEGPVSHRKGFTLIEFLIAMSIFTIMILAFISMFIAVTRVQVQQSSGAEVNQQSQFVLQELQYYIGQSSIIDMAANSATTTLRLRMAASSTDPTIISLSNGSLFLQQPGGSQSITSNNVTVSNLSFIKRSNPPSHDSVDISFTLSYNTSNLQQAFSQMFQTSVARVSAASFDSNLVPSSTATYSLGAAGQTWTSVNGVLYFSGSNVGIGASSPQQTLEINGGLRLNTAAATSTCNSTIRGTIWYALRAPAATDTLQLCIETSASTYTWVQLY